ncbi:Putative phosphoethanolamine transferase ybiP [Raoultella terrigena]|uniref:Phosphoethanolamine transferase ybiP n=1 Tax=Raoultella terrigena TaxID=577 RepID=A0A3P8M290_RAOTE|nr:Putative phosphoethanolamine transferase ybiP [Raoultella terrigena]
MATILVLLYGRLPLHACYICLLAQLFRARRRWWSAGYSLLAALYYPFGQAYGAPNFNTLLALHATNVEESTEILTIFPWYSYLLAVVLFFALGVIAVRRQAGTKASAGAKWRAWACCFSVGIFFLQPVQKSGLGRRLQGD